MLKKLYSNSQWFTYRKNLPKLETLFILCNFSKRTAHLTFLNWFYEEILICIRAFSRMKSIAKQRTLRSNRKLSVTQTHTRTYRRTSHPQTWTTTAVSPIPPAPPPQTCLAKSCAVQRWVAPAQCRRSSGRASSKQKAAIYRRRSPWNLWKSEAWKLQLTITNWI